MDKGPGSPIKMMFDVVVMWLAVPVVTSDGKEALVVSSYGCGMTCGGGFLVHWRKGDDGAWTPVDGGLRADRLASPIGILAYKPLLPRPMPFTATVLTMFPEAFPGPLGVSLIGTAWREQDLWRLETVDIRTFSKDKRGFLDDTPAGGGPGQVMKADVIAAALDSVDVAGRPLFVHERPGSAPDPGASQTVG
jgi:hypothetical protein